MLFPCYSSTYGFTTCVKGGLIDMCGTEFNDLLDTVYYDVVEDVIGDGFGCKESSSSDRLLGKISCIVLKHLCCDFMVVQMYCLLFN